MQQHIKILAGLKKTRGSREPLDRTIFVVVYMLLFTCCCFSSPRPTGFLFLSKHISHHRCPYQPSSIVNQLSFIQRKMRWQAIFTGIIVGSGVSSAMPYVPPWLRDISSEIMFATDHLPPMRSQGLEQDAVLKLWDEPYSKNSCPTSTPATTIILSPDVCLTINGFRSNDIKIKTGPVCANGSIPTFFNYPHAGCTEELDHGTEVSLLPIKDHCHHRESPQPFRWSMIFRCSKDTETPQKEENTSDQAAKSSLAESSIEDIHAVFHKADYNIRTIQKTFKPDICHSLTFPVKILPGQCEDSRAPLFYTFVRRNCKGNFVDHGQLEHTTQWDPKTQHTSSIVLACHESPNLQPDWMVYLAIVCYVFVPLNMLWFGYWYGFALVGPVLIVIASFKWVGNEFLEIDYRYLPYTVSYLVGVYLGRHEY
ncbi:hypothetical protein BKA61DRAFT_144181 [Leptodontidium sp. MPI-SDFR-AT-0119]|nr:hypothetical protein BKA61DRAFT_144181 [Leptodontidium sp. MPI-SDFR-AT-0119]